MNIYICSLGNATNHEFHQKKITQLMSRGRHRCQVHSSNFRFDSADSVITSTARRNFAASNGVNRGTSHEYINCCLYSERSNGILGASTHHMDSGHIVL